MTIQPNTIKGRYTMIEFRIPNASIYTLLLASALTLLSVALSGPAAAQESSANGSAGRLKIKSFSVSADLTLTYPSNLTNLPDEHTTIIPLSGPNDFPWAPGAATGTYLVFASSGIAGGNGGTVVLETTDLQNFAFATDRGYAEQVMGPPVPFLSCDPAFHDVFDENYAAPGSVLQDPTRPPGNLIMFYEAENHCPGDINQHFFYATVGFARSSDGGRTWPAPVDSEFGGPDRHPVLKGPIPEPPTNFFDGPMGNAIPSAFVDHGHIYVTYSSHNGGQSSRQGIRIARANFGDDQHQFADDDGPAQTSDGQFQFLKWNNGAFSEPGIGGADSPVVPVGSCAGRQMMSEITFNDDLGLYVMVFVCNTGPEDGHAAWFYSTATSLDLQDWTPPQMVWGSRYTVVTPCNLKDNTGTDFDGWYPSFMSPETAPGHTRLTGRAFFLNGCDTGEPRHFTSRAFTITAEREEGDLPIRRGS